MLTSVELFAGAGGLALGCELAGFNSQLVVEWDRWACDTIRQNKARGYPLVEDWSVHEGDVRKVEWAALADQLAGKLDLVAGGPPCQPFSTGGKHGGQLDKRDMFPATVDVIRQLRPRAFLVENVKGLTRATFSAYLHYIQLRLMMPEILPRDDEGWYDHYQRLQGEHTSTANSGLTYNLVPTVVNAADYGVPQKRERLFMVGFRSDVDAEWSFPEATHSKSALLHAQWVTGAYWDRHKIAKSRRPARPASLAQLLRGYDPDGTIRPWRTVRDALADLPAPTVYGSKHVLNHVLQPGARSYPGHTGSPLDEPAKTLKAGVHGVPGGENMLRDLDGSVRYFTVRESARLQTFPERYELHGAWGEAMRQLGNAVPVQLAQRVAGSIAVHLGVATVRAAGTKRSKARATA